MMFYRTSYMAWNLFLPARRSFKKRGEKRWTSRVIFGADMGWFGWRVTMLPRDAGPDAAAPTPALDLLRLKLARVLEILDESQELTSVVMGEERIAELLPEARKLVQECLAAAP